MNTYNFAKIDKDHQKLGTIITQKLWKLTKGNQSNSTYFVTRKLTNATRLLTDT